MSDTKNPITKAFQEVFGATVASGTNVTLAKSIDYLKDVTSFVITNAQFTEDTAALNKLLMYAKKTVEELEAAMGSKTEESQEHKNLQKAPTEILLKDADLPSEIINKLKVWEVTTLEDLKSKTEHDVTKYFGISHKTSMESLKKYMDTLGFEFKKSETPPHVTPGTNGGSHSTMHPQH